MESKLSSDPDSLLSAFRINTTCGFLPLQPCTRLSAHYSDWENLVSEVPFLLAVCNIRSRVERLPVLTDAALQEHELERAMLVLSILAHSYIFGEKPAAQELPEALAMPWVAVATRLRRPPVLSHGSIVVQNFSLIDGLKGYANDNLRLNSVFLGGMDESWFFLATTELEARSAPLYPAFVRIRSTLVSLIQSIPTLPRLKLQSQWTDHGFGHVAGKDLDSSVTELLSQDYSQVFAADSIVALRHAFQSESSPLPAIVEQLESVTETIQALVAVLRRLPERCEPFVFYLRVRPYLMGWKGNDQLPRGLVYRGAFDDKPQQFHGASAAQSAIFPALDAFLGVRHGDDRTKQFLESQREYIPWHHRQFIRFLEQGPSLASLVRFIKDDPFGQSLVTSFDQCVDALIQFRNEHIKIVASYVIGQIKTPNSNAERGTGGSSIMPFLKTSRDETASVSVVRHNIETQPASPKTQNRKQVPGLIASTTGVGVSWVSLAVVLLPVAVLAFALTCIRKR